MISSIRPNELHELRKQNKAPNLIDVRSATEYAAVHVEGAKHLPLNELTPDSIRPLLETSGDDQVFLICHSGGRSLSACQKLAAAGMKVVNVEGGTSAWAKAGLPVQRGRLGNVWRTLLPMLGLLVSAVGLLLVWTAQPSWGVAAVAAGSMILLAAGGGCCLGGACSLPGKTSQR